MDLANHVLKKNWLSFETMAKAEGELLNYIECFIYSVCFSASKVCFN